MTFPATVPAFASDDISPAALSAIDRRAKEIGRHIFDNLRVERPMVFQRRWWDDRIMAWAMHDEAVKVQLFRFVDVLPMLDSSDAVVGHLNEYLAGVKHRLPMPARVALGVAVRTPFTSAAVARAARLSAMDMARRFIAGTNTREVLAAAQRERKLGRGFTLDILGEMVASEAEAEKFFHAYLDLVEKVAPAVNAWPDDPRIDQSESGPLPRCNLSIKLSALDSQFDAVDARGALRRAGGRLRELLRVARRQKAFINVDMESYEKKDLTLAVFQEVLLEEEFRDVTDVGIVIQCYLRDSAADLARLRDWAFRRGAPVWVRLVKGAYWDYETIHAQSQGWPVPVYQEKWQSDANFERLTRLLMQSHKHLKPALGSHNIRSLAYGIATAEHLELPRRAFELQMLYGMADAQKQALVDLGCRMRIYMPYGELIPGMAYLVRRLLENTSNDSFLRAGFVERVSPDELLENPQEVGHDVAEAASFGILQDDRQAGSLPHDATDRDARPAETPMIHSPPASLTAATFQNHPPVNFASEANHQAMRSALESVAGELGGVYPLVIGGEKLETAQRIESLDPSRIDRVVGVVAAADAVYAQQAVAAARAAWPAWRALGAKARGDYLRRAADAMHRRLFELAAWEVYECGKGWREATADVSEAIDFCRYYANGAEALEAPQGADVPGELNRFEYLPRGVTAVIAPWNFPLAILTGMTTAALATGNTVVMKPAEQSSVMGALLMEIFAETGLPPGVLNYVPGPGETVGAALVEHPDVAVIAFTGSRAVGLAINAKAAQVSTTLTSVKRVIAEMGGKNAILVDDDADLDEAVLGVVKSAFGYQGQKCSACSRAIVVWGAYDAFLSRLVEATRSLQVGLAEDPATSVGPVIDEASRRKVQSYIELGRKEAREVLAVDVGPLADQGWFVGPHIFADVPPSSRLAQEEIFGPVLAVIRAADFDEALRIANATDYALTGGVYSRSPANLERARRELIVGNLYINRNITGALVGRQPFGGFKMSGIGSKAGGPDYLLQFVLPRTITENTMRRGFAPTSGE